MTVRDDHKPGPAPAPIPLTVLTGFLGAGKTSLLSRLLKDPALSDTAVLINEMGEISLDHLLVEQVGEGVVLLSSGCLCCSIRGDLVTALENLLRDLDNKRASFRRVVVETTGLADPAPVLHTIMAHPYLLLRFRLDGVVTLVDAVNAAATLAQHGESVKQVAVADRIVLTKSDLVDTEVRRLSLQRLLKELRALNPAAPILDGAKGEATAARLLDCGLYDASSKRIDVVRWLSDEAYAHEAAKGGRPASHDHSHRHAEHEHAEHEHADHDHAGHHHDSRIRSFSFATEKAIPGSTFDLFLELLRSLHGPNLLRVKGIVKLAECPDTPVVIHGVQHIFHPPVTLPKWPDQDRRTRLVFITYDIERSTVEKLFQAFIGNIAPDQPDREALVDNPLAPFGGLRG